MTDPRSATAQLEFEIACLGKDIADLKRLNSELMREIAMLESYTTQAPRPPQ